MKTAIITGASSGLGLEIGSLLQEKNYQVLNLSKTNSKFQNISINLAQDTGISKAIKLIQEEHPDFNLLILNAGIMPLANVGEIENVDELFQINVTGTIKLVNGLISLIKQNQADILIVGSTAALKGYKEHSAYCSSKHAVQGFIKSLQVELKNEPVRVIGFHPGGFNSNLRGGLIKEGYMDPKDLAKLAMNLIELPKNMEVSEVVINRKKSN